MPANWFTAILIFSAAIFGFLSLALLWEMLREWRAQRRVAQRVHELIEAQDNPTALARQKDLLRGSDESAEGGSFGLAALTQLLSQARLEWRPGTFLLITVGLSLGLGGAVLVLTGSFVLTFLAAVAGAAWPYFYARHRRARRLLAFEEEFPEAIDLLTRAIRAGHPLSAGIRMVSDEGPQEVATEFRQVFEEQRFGLPFEEALLGMVDRTNLVDVRIFAIAVLIQREVGGNLAEILDNLAHTIRGRFYIRRQLRVYTAQGRLSGYALMALPIMVGSFVALTQPEYIGLLFSTLIGWFMVIGAIVLQIIGGLWIRQIINIDI
jgi:tight adherence protein B